MVGELAELALLAPSAAPSTASGLTILVADDDPDLLALMARRLTKGGYLVVTAVDGQQAVELAAEVRPDLALLDVMMPKLSGLEVTARLRADPTTTTMKIILVSAGFQPGDQDAATLVGADGCIVKPFERDEPLGCIRTVLAG